MLTHKQINEAYDAGRTCFASFNKTPSQTTASGIWYDLSMSSGNPVAQYYSGATLTSTALKRSTDVGINHGQPIGSDYKKFLHKVDIQVVLATGAPLTIEMLDYVMFYSGISMDAGVQEFTNSIPLPRHTDDRGLQMMLVEIFPYTGSADVQITYTNQDGVAGRLSPVLRLNTQSVFGTVATSAPTTAGAGGLFVPLQNGDSGVQSVQSIEVFGAGDVGVLALVIVKPIASFHIVEVTQPTMFDMWCDFSVLPEIADDAYLNLVVLPVGTLASANILGNITTFWSPV